MRYCVVVRFSRCSRLFLVSGLQTFQVDAKSSSYCNTMVNLFRASNWVMPLCPVVLLHRDDCPHTSCALELQLVINEGRHFVETGLK